MRWLVECWVRWQVTGDFGGRPETIMEGGRDRLAACQWRRRARGWRPGACLSLHAPWCCISVCQQTRGSDYALCWAQLVQARISAPKLTYLAPPSLLPLPLYPNTHPTPSPHHTTAPAPACTPCAADQPRRAALVVQPGAQARQPAGAGHAVGRILLRGDGAWQGE